MIHKYLYWFYEKAIPERICDEIVLFFNNKNKSKALIGEDKVIKFSGCQRNEACSIVVRGSGNHILDEAERSLHDAICVLLAAVKNHKMILGGGNAEIRMALAV